MIWYCCCVLVLLMRSLSYQRCSNEWKTHMSRSITLKPCSHIMNLIGSTFYRENIPYLVGKEDRCQVKTVEVPNLTVALSCPHTPIPLFLKMFTNHHTSRSALGITCKETLVEKTSQELSFCHRQSCCKLTKALHLHHGAPRNRKRKIQ